LINKDYLIFLYENYFKSLSTNKGFSQGSTKLKASDGTTKIHIKFIIITRRYVFLNYFYDLFYKDKVKVIPNIIGDLITPQV